MSQQVRKREEPSIPVAFRTSTVVRLQLDQLMAKWGENQTQTIIRCIERAWIMESEEFDVETQELPPLPPSVRNKKKTA